MALGRSHLALAAGVGCLLTALSAGAPSAQDAAGAAEGPSFEREVLPILEARCFRCHGPEAKRVKGDLLLDSRASMLRGGDLGPAAVPGDADRSLLVQAVRWDDDLLQMPPDRKLPAEEIGVLERWVAAGATWPDGLVPLRAVEGAAPSGRGDAIEASAPKLEPALARYFERRVRPLLADNCFECHGPDVARPKGGLRMGPSGLLAGGDSGPALVPGAPEESRLVRAVRYADDDLQMPPDGRLSDDDVRTLEEWIALGAPWPDTGEEARVDEDRGIDYEAGREWWAFRPVADPPVPRVAHAERVAQPLDAFWLARLEEAGLEPPPQAEPRELVRRAWFDLLGLPPTPEAVDAFVADPSERAWAALVDDLLARPEFGERWARHWLDLVRFAQTNGYERDAEKPYAWRYRDWVVAALNEDLPYDRFLTEQLAGDELPDADDDSLIATGFYRLGPWDDEPDDANQAVFDEYDDVLRTVSEGMLGVTVGCARCHDHRYDPISQADYYGLLSFVSNVQPADDASFSLDSRTLVPLDLTPARRAEWERARDERIALLQAEHQALTEKGRRLAIEAALQSAPERVRRAWATPEEQRTPKQRELLRTSPALEPEPKEVRAALDAGDRASLRDLFVRIGELERSFEGSLEWALAVRERGTQRRTTRLLVRGEASTPGEEVVAHFPPVLCATEAVARPFPPEPTEHSTGTRSQLAAWITDPAHPTTARVAVNRAWQHLFGRGIVPTPNDFGKAGMPPTHPLLLDHLATGFVADGWSTKRLLRRILTSSAYRASSHAGDPRGPAQDPGNDLFWRQNPRRLEAEAIRDATLAVSGELSRERGGRGFFADLGREVIAGMSKPGSGWGVSTEEERCRRTLYAYSKRGVRMPFIELFDGPNPSLPTGERPTTTLPTQALLLLNSDFVNARAAAFAERLRAECGDDRARRVERAFRLALGRLPSDEERAIAAKYLDEQTRAFERVEPELVFEPRLPARLEFRFLDELRGEDLMYGPASGWTYLKGLWGTGYNETLEANRLQGPAALHDGLEAADGRLEARFRLEQGCRDASLLLRAERDGDVFRGVELALLPEEGVGELRFHWGADAEPSILARAPLALAAEVEHALLVELDGATVRASLDGSDEPQLAAALPLVEGGRIGVRCRGEGLHLAQLRFTGEDGVHVVAPDDAGSPAERAFESFCLLVLNLNEFVHVD